MILFLFYIILTTCVFQSQEMTAIHILSYIVLGTHFHVFPSHVSLDVFVLLSCWGFFYNLLFAAAAGTFSTVINPLKGVLHMRHILINNAILFMWIIHMPKIPRMAPVIAIGMLTGKMLLIPSSYNEIWKIIVSNIVDDEIVDVRDAPILFRPIL